MLSRPQQAATVKWMCHGDHCTVNGGLISGIFRSKSIFANSICVYLCRVCQCMSCISPYIIVYLDNYTYNIYIYIEMDLFSCQLNIAIMTVIISTMVPKKTDVSRRPS